MSKYCVYIFWNIFMGLVALGPMLTVQGEESISLVVVVPV